MCQFTYVTPMQLHVIMLSEDLTLQYISNCAETLEPGPNQIFKKEFSGKN